MDADGLEDETLPLDRNHTENSFLLSYSALTAFPTTVVLPSFSVRPIPNGLHGPIRFCSTFIYKF